MSGTLFKIIVSKMPELGLKLKQAHINDEPDYFIKKTVLTSLYTTIFVMLIFFMFFSKIGIGMKLVILFLGTPIIFSMVFSYFLKYPEVVIKKRAKDINQEIVFAIRFLIIEIESGVPLYNAMKNIVKNYEKVGVQFADIINKIDLGTSMSEAIKEATDTTPSDELRKVFWQLSNSLHTGSSAVEPLTSVLEQIVRLQQIEVKEYGRKLNPLAMFYMMIAVIVPSLGITMMVVLATFLGLKMSLAILLFVVMLLGFMQFMFLSIIKSSRPSVEL